MKKDRVYVDTSVIGGCLDVEFAAESNRLMDMAKDGEIVLIVSDLLLSELALAPEKVRAVIAELPRTNIKTAEVSPESESLMRAYLKAKIVGRHSENDAHHVALATIATASVILSWNFKHIVHLDKIKKFNAVNLVEGYGLVEIRTPKEYV